MCHRFRSHDNTLVLHDVVDVYKSAPKTNVAENTAVIHGLSQLSIIATVCFDCLMVDWILRKWFLLSTNYVDGLKKLLLKTLALQVKLSSE